MKRLLTLLTLLTFTLPVIADSRRPNVIIILSDDQGYGDVGFNGGTDIPTPHLDLLAANGTIFRAGYATHPYCSPSRAGLITGRYQHRFGHENNTPYGHDDPNAGLPLTETTIADLMKANGYATAAIGKWHLGDFEKFWPTQRGFDYWYGLYGGGMSYWGDTRKKPEKSGILRNGKIVPQSEITYLTDDFTDETIDFIDRNADNPFFIYLAYNAPHGPLHAPQKYLDEVEHIEDGNRAAYAALVVGLDHGVGRVIDKLKTENLYENTLIFFYSDNGGHLNGASSAPYRGNKGMLFEGGIRVPFTVTWGSKLAAGQEISEPIIALDIFPTILSASGITAPENLHLDGFDLLPLLSGNESSLPSRALYWRCSDGAGYAVRKGNYKIVKSIFKKEPFLFDLRADPFEHQNLAKSYPEKFDELNSLFKRWNTEMIPSKWSDPHFANADKQIQARQKHIDAAKQGEKK